MADDEEDLDVPVTNDLERKIADAFEVFDHTASKMVDVREVSTILRGLGLCPTEAEIQEIIVATEHPRIPGSVHLRQFLPYVVQVITEHKFGAATPEELLDAFRALDFKGIGFLTREEITTFMTQDGEPFTQDEIDEMLELAIDPNTQTLPYEYYINQLMFEPKGEDNIYNVADRVEAEKAAAIEAALTAKRFKFF